MPAPGKKTIVTAALILLITFAASLASGPALFSSYIEQQLIAAANSGTLSVSPRGVIIGAAAVKVNSLRLFYAPFMTGLDLQELQISPSWRHLRGLALPLEVSAAAYEGSLKGRLSLPLSGKQINGELSLRDLDLSQHPQLQGLGVASGRLSLDWRQGTWRGKEPPTGNLGLELTGFSIPRAATYSLPRGGQSILVPRIMDLNLSLSGELKDRSLSLTRLHSASQFGEVRGSGTLDYLPGGKASFDLAFKVKPTTEGQALIALLKSQLPDGGAYGPTPGGSWLITLRGSQPPRMEIVPE